MQLSSGDFQANKNIPSTLMCQPHIYMVLKPSCKKADTVLLSIITSWIEKNFFHLWCKLGRFLQTVTYLRVSKKLIYYTHIHQNTVISIFKYQHNQINRIFISAVLIQLELRSQVVQTRAERLINK